MNKRLTGIIILITVLLVGMLAFFLRPKTPDENARKARPSPVEVTAVRRKPVNETVEAVGTTRAWESVTLTVNVTEYVTQLHFEDGDEVRKGDLLVELQSTEEKALLAEANARLLESEAQYGRIKKLRKSDFAAQAEYDTQKANIESAKARIDQINSFIADRTLKAPFDGVLGFRQISPGTLLEPGDSIATLDMIQALRLDFNLPEKYLAKVQAGMPFTAYSIAFPDTRYTGKIHSISPRIDAQSRSLLLRGALENPDKHLKPGMLMHINLTLEGRDVLVIPEEALMAQGKTRYVYKVDEKNQTANRHPVELIKRNGEELWIKGELTEGDLIVTQGAFRLRDGQAIKY